jgi:hypothetical protein
MGAYGGYGLRRPADHRPTYMMLKTASIGLDGAFPEVGSYQGSPRPGKPLHRLPTGVLSLFYSGLSGLPSVQPEIHAMFPLLPERPIVASGCHAVGLRRSDT